MKDHFIVTDLKLVEEIYNTVCKKRQDALKSVIIYLHSINIRTTVAVNVCEHFKLLNYIFEDSYFNNCHFLCQQALHYFVSSQYTPRLIVTQYDIHLYGHTLSCS